MGEKNGRINLALKPENYEYVRIMSKAAEKTKTRFINDLIEADREKNAERYDAAKEKVESAARYEEITKQGVDRPR